MIGDNIKNIRESKKIGLNELARKAGVSQGYLSAIERGAKKNPSIDFLNKVADSLNVEPSVFFGINSYHEREEIKKNCRNIFKDNNCNKEEKYKSAISYFKTYYERSLESSGFNPEHVSLDKFISMLLYNEFLKDEIPDEIYKLLIENFGTCKGIEKGSSYYIIPKETKNNSSQIDAIAAHLEGKNITPKKMKLLEKYIDTLFGEFDED